MDVWVVAAAAGAGYVAQRLKNLSGGKLSLGNPNIGRPESSITREKAEHKSCPLRRVLSKKRFGEERERDSSCEAEMASTSGYEDENPAMVDNFPSYSSIAGFLSNEDIQGDWENRVTSGIDEACTSSDTLPNPSSSEIGFSYRLRRNRSSVRSRRINSQLMEPRTSLESCLMAQLYSERAEIEEYTYSLHPLPKPTVRPFLVSDGSRIISTVACGPSEQTGMGRYKLRKDKYSRKDNNVHGLPRLPSVAPVELQKKAKARNRKEQVLRRNESSKKVHGNPNNLQGTPDRTLLFYLGLTMGIISSFLANKQETEKLNKLLKQSQNLVQDLQEDLEMKDSLTVKELAVEDYESQDVHNDNYFDDAMHALSHEHTGDEECCNQKAEEESLSKIEAELEAELERLESNMKSSRLEGKLSNLTELDPDLVSDVLEGDLRADLFSANNGSQPYADRDGSGVSTPCSVHYPVSPRELSLRLHEVIQSRLEERVKELEMELQNSQRKVRHYQFINRSGTSSTQDSPIAGDERQSVDQPVIINLSGEALAAYNEVYEVFANVSESDEEVYQSRFENGDGVQNGHMQHLSVSNGNLEMAFDREKEENSHVPSINAIVCNSRDESEDEMERMLIRQIVEKAKQGSPAVLKVQRALLSTRENDLMSIGKTN